MDETSVGSNEPEDGVGRDQILNCRIKTSGETSQLVRRTAVRDRASRAGRTPPCPPTTTLVSPSSVSTTSNAHTLPPSAFHSPPRFFSTPLPTSSQCAATSPPTEPVAAMIHCELARTTFGSSAVRGRSWYQSCLSVGGVGRAFLKTEAAAKRRDMVFEARGGEGKKGGRADELVSSRPSPLAPCSSSSRP